MIAWLSPIPQVSSNTQVNTLDVEARRSQNANIRDKKGYRSFVVSTRGTGGSRTQWGLDMGTSLKADERQSLDVLANEKVTLRTSRRSVLAGSKLIAGAGVALALGLAGRSSSARAKDGDSPHGDERHGGEHAEFRHGGEGWFGNGGEGTGIHPGGGGGTGSSCFLPGTRIKTTKGEVRIEELRIGDSVLTVSGEAKPIKFVGRRELSREPSQAWAAEGPVKISRFAIDDKSPQVDLYVSPEHAIYIDGVLIPARNLVNGVTIVANAKPEALSLTYFHIELDTHDAILAEGLAVETYQRNNLHSFDNVDEYLGLYGLPEEPLTPFAPIVSYGGVRQELASHIRSALAPVYDVRKPIDTIRDRIADRAECAA